MGIKEDFSEYLNKHGFFHMVDENFITMPYIENDFYSDFIISFSEDLWFKISARLYTFELDEWDTANKIMSELSSSEKLTRYDLIKDQNNNTIYLISTIDGIFTGLNTEYNPEFSVDLLYTYLGSMILYAEDDLDEIRNMYHPEK